MNNTKKLSACLILVIFFITSIIAGIALVHLEANAAAPYFSAEKYTEDDRLLLPNGERASKKIDEFADEVKNGENGQSFPELSQVIPLDFLETTEGTKELQYNGSEYGFYIIKEGVYFDLLLYDFAYEFEDPYHSDLEYIIKIKPLLQKSFIRKETENGFEWTLTTDTRPKYYVANPRFLTVIQNENALNFGDPGYTKLSDEGVIIIQNRINYGGVDYKTSDDFWAVCAEFAAQKVLSAATDIAISFLDEDSGDLLGFIMNLLELTNALYEGGQETVYQVGNETNIFTRQSKSTQRSGLQEGYSRVATFKPETEIILSEDENSFAEFIVVLSETNYPTHLSRYCEFDIVKRIGDYGSMINADKTVYSFSRDNVLFKDDSTKKLTLETPAPVYTLPNGTDSFIFNSLYASDYNIHIESNNNFNVSIDDKTYGNENNISFYSDAQKDILIDISAEGGVLGEITISPNTNDSLSKIPVNGQYLLKTDLSGVKKLSTNNPDLNITNICKLNNGILSDYTDYGEINPYFEITYPFFDDTYYILIDNILNNDITSQTFTETDVPNLQTGSTTVNLTASNLNYFKIIPPTTATYQISFSGLQGDNFSYALLYSDFSKGKVLSLASSSKFLIALEGNNTYYFGIKTGENENQISVELEQTSNIFQWKVSGGEFGSTGRILTEGNVNLERGITYELSFLVDGQVVDTDLSYEDLNTSWGIYGISQSGNSFTFPVDCPIGGNGVIVYPSNLEEGSSLFHALNLIPIGNPEPYNISIENGDDIDLSIDVSRFIKRIEFTLSDGRVSKSAYVEFSDSEVNNNYNYQVYNLNALVEQICNSEAVDITLDITSVLYYDALHNLQQNDEYNFSLEFNNLFADGKGTSSSPYTITCLRHLYNIRKSSSSHFDLLRNLTCTEQWEAIPEFDGTLNGNDFTIVYENLAVPYGQNYGFIAINNGDIKDITFKTRITVSDKPNDNTETVYAAVGGAVGINYGNLYMINIEKTIPDPYLKFSGVALLDLYARNNFALTLGGICGYNYGELQQCYNYASLGGEANIGGITGLNMESARLINCENSGNIYFNHANYASVSIGGIAGTIRDKGHLENCSNWAEITWSAKLHNAYISHPNLGQLAGQACSTIVNKNNHSFGSVIITADVRPLLTYQQMEHVNNGDFGLIFDPPKESTDDEPEEGGGDGGSCIAIGTLITLADGSQVPVESLTGNEDLLVWDMQTGTFTSAPIMFIDKDPYNIYRIINLSFSDGTTLKIITEHALWDYNLNRYVFMDEQSSQYIGHWFNKQTISDSGQFINLKVQLIDVSITTEYSVAYSPVTYNHLCYYVNGMLSMPGATEGLINIFDVDPITMSYDTKAMTADITQYGLFSYEEFSKLFSVSEDVFIAFNGQFLKVSIGKGLITIDELQNLIQQYAEFLV